MYDEQNSLQFNTSILEGAPTISRADPDLFDLNGVQRKRYDFDHDDVEAVEDKQLPTKAALEAIAVAHRIQTDLETVAMDFVRHWKAKTGQTNLCLTGGVCLNSVLNGRLSREFGFEQTFVSPYPGDEGISFGCCGYGLFDKKFLDPKKHKRPACGLEVALERVLWSRILRYCHSSSQRISIQHSASWIIYKNMVELGSCFKRANGVPAGPSPGEDRPPPTPVSQRPGHRQRGRTTVTGGDAMNGGVEKKVIGQVPDDCTTQARDFLLLASPY